VGLLDVDGDIPELESQTFIALESEMDDVLRWQQEGSLDDLDPEATIAEIKKDIVELARKVLQRLEGPCGDLDDQRGWMSSGGES
jgi:hypothetical protein